jgi:hypothetical protein
MGETMMRGIFGISPAWGVTAGRQPGIQARQRTTYTWLT